MKRGSKQTTCLMGGSRFTALVGPDVPCRSSTTCDAPGLERGWMHTQASASDCQVGAHFYPPIACNKLTAFSLAATGRSLPFASHLAFSLSACCLHVPQWIDVTGVPSGRYRLRLEVNAARHFAEESYDNNVEFVPVEIP